MPRKKRTTNPFKNRFAVAGLMCCVILANFGSSIFVSSVIEAQKIDKAVTADTPKLPELVELGEPIKADPKYVFTASPPPPPPAPVQRQQSTTPAASTKPAPPKPARSSAAAKSAPKPSAAAESTPATGGLETATSLSFVNSVRASAGKPPLTQNSVMNGWALAHAQTLAASCSLYHQNLNSFLGRNIGPKTVQSIAENVGYAGSTASVLNALKNSPDHYANMIGDYTYVGFGVVRAGGACDGHIYTTQLFAK